MSQRQINSAHRRSLKPSYKGFSDKQRNLIQCCETVERNYRSCANIERHLKELYGQGWRAKYGVMKESDQREHDVFSELLLENLNLSDKISRLETQLGIDRDELLKQFREYNSRRFSGSF